MQPGQFSMLHLLSASEYTLEEVSICLRLGEQVAADQLHKNMCLVGLQLKTPRQGGTRSHAMRDAGVALDEAHRKSLLVPERSFYTQVIKELGW